MNDVENLSIKLFKTHKHPKETSSIFGSVKRTFRQMDNALDGNSDSHWYRILRRPQWTWQGVDPIEMDEILARIAASKKSRTVEALLDTVKGYQPGNWSYEWAQGAMLHEKCALAWEEKGDNKKAAIERLRSCTYFSIASYPHLNGDALSLQAQALANKAFQAWIEKAPFKVKSVVIEVDGKSLEGFLYLPHTNEPLRTVIVSGGLDSLQTDLWPIFETYFAPANIAMFTLDMPSIGRSQAWNLNEDTSRLHQAMLHELVNLPWVDNQRIGCMGIRFGGNAAVRLAFLEETKIKSCVSIGGILHSMLEDAKHFDRIPPMYLDAIASRMGKAEATSSLLTQLQSLSLKNQGLLAGRSTPVPILALRLEDDPICTESDNQLVAFYSQGGAAKKIASNPVYDSYHRIMLDSIAWFDKTL